MMPIYLIVAYAVFVGGTLALACSIRMRRRQIEREIERLEARLSGAEAPTTNES
jgi:hypothetical protein